MKRIQKENAVLKQHVFYTLPPLVMSMVVRALVDATPTSVNSPISIQDSQDCDSTDDDSEYEEMFFDVKGVGHFTGKQLSAMVTADTIREGLTQGLFMMTWLDSLKSIKDQSLKFKVIEIQSVVVSSSPMRQMPMFPQEMT